MFKIALCQIVGSADREQNRAKVEKYVREAASNGAKIICLPEMWNCPYSNDYFRKYAETVDGPAVQLMSGLAKELGIYLIGGTIAELEPADASAQPSADAPGKVYNTSFCFGPDGEIIGRHRKVHLFDIDVKGKIRFMESDTLTAGDEMTVIDTEFCQVGVAICYDVRFPEWFRKMTLAGAKVIFLPAAFNTTTGPAHWELLMKTRAFDNQVYFAANAPAQDPNGIFKAYGHSMIVDPWGKTLASAEFDETVIYADIDLDYVQDIRDQLPLLKHRRPELY